MSASVALPQDTFAGRTVSGSWGTASDGVTTYSTASGSGTLAVASSEGTFNCTSGQILIMKAGSNTWTDMGVLCRIQGSSTANTLDVFVRYTDSTHYYRLSILLSGLSLVIGMKNGGSFSTLASANVSYTPAASTPAWFRLHAVGNVLYAKSWLASGSEPTTWTVTYTDNSSTFLSGGVAIGGNTNASGDVLTFDNLSAYPIYSDSMTAGDSPAPISAFNGVDNNDGYRAIVLNDTPIGYWRLHESSGSTVSDETGNGNNGTLSGTGTTQGVSGLIIGDTDTAYTFNGSGYIALPTAPMPAGVRPWSIEGLCSVSTVAPSYQCIAGFGMRNSQQAAMLFIHNNGSTAQAMLSTYSGDISGGTVTVGPFYHVVGTYDGTQTRVYLNGTKVAGPTSFTENVVVAFASIGADGTSGGNDRFQGTIDEVAIYDYALSSAQITAHYNASVAFQNETLSESEAYTFSDSLSMAEASTATTVDSFTDASSVVDSFLVSNSPSSIDSLSLIDQMSKSSTIMFTDTASLAESSTSSVASSWSDILSLLDAFSMIENPSIFDSLSLADQFSQSCSPVLTDLTSLLDRLSVTDNPKFADALSILDSLSVYAFAVPTVIQSFVGSDGLQAFVSVDGLLAFTGVDGLVHGFITY